VAGARNSDDDAERLGLLAKTMGERAAVAHARKIPGQIGVREA
jgi:hypothetical protein